MLNDPVTAAITRLRMDLETARAALTRGRLGHAVLAADNTSFLQATMPLTDDDRSRRRRFA